MTELDAFLPPVRQWFESTLGAPTPPQAQAWPAIQRGEHVLILSPTGSGKTLAAFYAGIDSVFRELLAAAPQNADSAKSVSEASRKRAKTALQPSFTPGVRLLYISPLKALNSDVQRNLEAPLAGIRAAAESLGQPLPELRTAVRTGDTPAVERQRMLKKPPHILITTPESLYLMLTSPQAREIFRTVRSVIVDEIHTLVGDKRGSHLALSLERLERLRGQPIQRIALSATIKPLDTVASFLGGQDRAVTVVNVGYKKALDLSVITAVDDFAELAGASIWPHVIPRVLADIATHTTTLIFANNRRLAERTADRLNAQLAGERDEALPPGSSEVLAPGGIPRDGGIAALGAEGPFRAHHGSMSKEARRSMEADLKAGRLPALVGTSSLELGIDIGAIDLVVQLQSPKSVAQGLQRVGRAGHQVGQTSVGRIYTSHREDVIEAAAVVRGMLDGDVEPTHSPENPLDVLAQHVVSMVAQESWDVDDLFALVTRAHPYRGLPRRAFDLVLAMLAGRYAGDTRDAGESAAKLLKQLRPRLSWDTVANRLSALPGTRMAAISVAGTITDRGAFGVYLGDGKTKIGELDEEFVFETTVGNAFLLGSQTWRVTSIQDDRILVQDAAGASPRMPFWRGDMPWRAYELGERIGRFRRQIAERLSDPGVFDWLLNDYRCDVASARNILEHVQRQIDAGGRLGTDKSIVVESFDDELGARHWAIHSPYGGRVNGAWALAISSALREKLGAPVESHVDDDGMLFRLPQLEHAPPVSLVRMAPDEARERILRELPESAVFGAHFRMNAQRALLLPNAVGRKRTPFWLQRLKAKDLLALVRQFDDFPIVVETFRDCLIDAFDLPHLEQVLARLSAGALAPDGIDLVSVASKGPSPLAAGLLKRFEMRYMYEWDQPKAERQLRALSMRREVLAELLGTRSGDLSGLLNLDAATPRSLLLQGGVDERDLQSLEALAVALFEAGDMSDAEAARRAGDNAAAWLAALQAAHRIVALDILSQRRWVHAERRAEYETGLSTNAAVLWRFLANAGIVTRSALLARYPFDTAWLDGMLADAVAAQTLVRGRFTKQALEDEFCNWGMLEQLHRRSIAALRKEAAPAQPEAFTHFLLRHQHVAPECRLTGADGLRAILQQLSGWSAPHEVWQNGLIAARCDGIGADALGALFAGGEFVWAASGRRARIFGRGQGGIALPDDSTEDAAAFSHTARAIYDFLKQEGASLLEDIAAGVECSPNDAIDALAELTLAGQISADAWAALGAVLAYKLAANTTVQRASNRGNAPNALASELAARLGSNDAAHQRAMQLRRPSSAVMRGARQRVRTRLSESVPVSHWREPWRWASLKRIAVLGKPLDAEQRADAVARQLLLRHGLLSHDIVSRDFALLGWSELYPHLQRMEMRGELRRGYFVSGLAGAQFMWPEQLEQLRDAARDLAAPNDDDAVVVLSAADPALIAISHDARSASFARVPSTSVLVWRGRAVLVIEDGGARVSVAADVPMLVVERALRAWLSAPAAPRHTVIESWNGLADLDAATQALLTRIGFGRSPNGFELWRS